MRTAGDVAMERLTRVLEHARESGWPDEWEDDLLDVMDQLEGWCSPRALLVFPPQKKSLWQRFDEWLS